MIKIKHWVAITHSEVKAISAGYLKIFKTIISDYCSRVFKYIM